MGESIEDNCANEFGWFTTLVHNTFSHFQRVFWKNFSSLYLQAAVLFWVRATRVILYLAMRSSFLNSQCANDLSKNERKCRKCCLRNWVNLSYTFFSLQNAWISFHISSWMPCVLSTKLVYENEARPVCFLSSDARRAEFLPNKLTVFLNGFRFFT